MDNFTNFMAKTIAMFLVCIVFVLIGLYMDKEWEPMQAFNELPITFGLLLLFTVVGSFAVKTFMYPILSMIPGVSAQDVEDLSATKSESAW